MIRRFEKVVPGLYRGGAPTVKDIAVLKKLGIKTIVSLDYKIGKRIDRACRLLGIQHIMIPIAAKDIGSVEKLSKLNWKKLLLGTGPTFVHCLHGKDRTGMVVAMFRVQSGWSPEKAIQEADRFDFCVGLNPKVRKSFEKAIRASDSKDVNNSFSIPMNDAINGDSILNPSYDVSNYNSFAVPYYPSTNEDWSDDDEVADKMEYFHDAPPQIGGSIRDDGFANALETGNGYTGYGFSEDTGEGYTGYNDD